MGKPVQRRKKPAHKPRPQPASSHAPAAAAEEALDVLVDANGATTHRAATSLPPCVQQLRESTQYTVLEDACSDIARFALQAKHNEAFLAEGVPQRLTQLLLFTSPCVPAPENRETASAEASAGESPAQQAPHKGILYLQIAAADALRSLVQNSEQDRVVDALTEVGVVDAISGASFAEGLVALVRADWAGVQAARRRMTPDDWMEVFHEDDNDGEGEARGDEGREGEPEQPSQRRSSPHGGTARNLYFTLLRHLEEVLALASVCVEASEACAAAFSEASALCQLLEISRVATTTTWETLLHPSARYFMAEDGAPAKETILAMRAYKRREACLLAAVAVVTSDVLLLLSPENPSLTQVLMSDAATAAAHGATASSAVAANGLPGDMTSAQRQFLNTAVDAVDLRVWLAEKPSADVQMQERFSDASLPSFVHAGTAATPPTALSLERERILYDLLRATLSIQGMLLHTAPVAANMQKVLPLLCAALDKVSLPIHAWCALLPILMDTCEAGDEELWAATTALATHRLRATQSAVRVLHILVNAVGEQNDARVSAEQDDEAAFAVNPLAPLLRSQNLFYTFGLLLKDVLWMSNTAASPAGGPTDVMAQQAQQRALRAEASANAAATEIQMVLLSTEVNVWEVASTLLLMLPVASLGDPSLTWRALVQAVQHRYELHLDAAASTALAAAEEQPQDLPSSVSHVNIVQHSRNAHQLIWMQLESLVQMLWTMQRKQSKAHGSAVTATNDVCAVAADVDLLVRLSWESVASARLKQACVGTVGLLCAAMQQAEAAATATRFALAALANAGPSATFGQPLADAYATLVAATVPTYPAERRVWMQQLSLVDAAATVRGEAANTLVDLFLDERYDASVYWPLKVQDGLKAFKAQLNTYVKRRTQLDKETKRKLHLSTENPEAEQWAEVLENLDGFLDYKQSTK